MFILTVIAPLVLVNALAALVYVRQVVVEYVCQHVVLDVEANVMDKIISKYSFCI